MSKMSPWKRLLWLKQEYPDNYTDPSFIELRIRQNNESGKKSNRKLSEAASSQIRLDFISFYQTVLNTSFIYITFTYIYYYGYNPIPPTIILSFLTLVISRKKVDPLLSSFIDIKSSLIITFAMLTLSPVLKSLSKTTASDSIWTLSFWLSVWYVFVISSTSSKHKPSNLSTNILVALVAVLSSRLSTTIDVFCFLLICIQLNIILPSYLSVTSKVVPIISNIIVYSFLNVTLGWIYMLLVFFASVFYIIVLPRWFIYWKINYHKKDNDLLSTWDARAPILD
ncbi:phosphatidylinositol N-acetylglucosaminyltransferase [Saccharomyces eubayanus]|uniref:phosphatidylinositol N-acetylglucosaminyltransferase n=1 Tax=Saccharomyces eubayanus TaxID=1080349 RepID=UPI0006C1A6A2|nr:GPI2-like protein [Saccharomyces eubayanus]KOG96237.1 GPI2-like protein [Saccharomyces eubayanus]